jgi:hypothetical protein
VKYIYTLKILLSLANFYIDPTDGLIERAFKQDSYAAAHTANHRAW